MHTYLHINTHTKIGKGYFVLKITTHLFSINSKFYENKHQRVCFFLLKLDGGKIVLFG